MVLVMTVGPRFVGQKFIKSQLDKLKEIKQMNINTNPDLLITVDGNINAETIPQRISTGANILVAGTSSIFKGEDANYDELAKLMRNQAAV